MFQDLIIVAAADPAVGTVIDAATSGVTDNLPQIITGIAGIAAAAFGIKAIWVAWRAGSKAVGKTGT